MKEFMAKQAMLAKQAKITMDQAIQYAVNQHPGTPTECVLGRERGEVLYMVNILSGEGDDINTIRVWVSAIDGLIITANKLENPK